MHCFRNYKRFQLQLTENRLLVLGSNGIGKSNLLEAVELLGTLRSHRSNNDSELIFWDKESSILRGITNENETLELILNRRGGRKVFRNSKAYKRQLDLLDSIKCVGFSSFDLSLVRGEPSLRRNWLDRLVQQLEPIYGELISRYGKLLRQRSQLLRNYRGSYGQNYEAILDTFDSQMALVSTRIHRRRRRALIHLQPRAEIWQKKLSHDNEHLNISYLPGSFLEGEEEELSWRMAIEKQLLDQREEEERLGFCKVGPHRDEVTFLLNGVVARKFASAGQQRTIVLSLKLAELEIIAELSGESPILLLDDVLAELDPGRQLLLLDAVGDRYQCLISATHVGAFESNWKQNAQILDL